MHYREDFLAACNELGYQITIMDVPVESIYLDWVESRLRDSEEKVRQLSEYIRSMEGSKMEWISVKDRLPERNQEVLFVSTANFVHRGFFNGIVWWDNYHNYDATHWMPIPDPPKKTMEGSK